MNEAYLIIGGNLGNKQKNIAQAKKLIEEKAGRIVAASSIYETEPWGNVAQPEYYNQVLKINTALISLQLLQCVLHIECTLGRVRTIKYGARVMDIDILFFNDEVQDTAALTLPHPQLQNRRFVLQPLAEIAPELVHPVLKKTITQLLNACADALQVKKIDT